MEQQTTASQRELQFIETDRLLRALERDIALAKQNAQHLSIGLALMTCVAQEIMEQCNNCPDDDAGELVQKFCEELVATVAWLEKRAN